MSFDDIVENMARDALPAFKKLWGIYIILKFKIGELYL